MAEITSTKRIHKLPDDLVNRIAAGEVIERPASVVKELLENSLDAGATKITLEIRGGGTRLIRVTDNGHGIHPDDLLVAIDRHTTSKLDNDSDLFRISTLGFRGEALSSIASVARLKLTSRQQNVDHGWSVDFESTQTPQPAPHPVGTTVEVRDLFYNTPARRKFLRSERTESLHIHELVKRIALSRFNLDLCFIQDDRQVLLLSDDTDEPAQRIVTVMGKPFLKKSVMVDQQFDDMSLYGRAGFPDIARSQSDQQYFYLNGRIIKDKLINHAVRMAYEDTIYPGRHPSYVLFLDMDCAAADINVHPTKHEVRFRDTRKIHDFIYGSLSRVLGEKPQENFAGEQNTDIGINRLPDNNAVNEKVADYEINRLVLNNERENAFIGVPVGQIKGRFLITENSTGMILLDIYRMRELITRTRLKREYDTGEIKTRPVLVPLMVSVNNNGVTLIEQHKHILEKCGLILQQISPGSIQIRALPVILAYADAVSLTKNCISILEQKNDLVVDDLLNMLSQHANDNSPLKPDSHELKLLLTDFIAIRDQIPDAQLKQSMRQFDLESIMKLIDGKK